MTTNSVTVYGMIFDRGRQGVERLLDHFSNQRIPCAATYEFPQYAENPRSIHSSYQCILSQLEGDTNEPYTLYWDVVDPTPQYRIEQLIAIYTADGALIIGLAVPASHAVRTLHELKTIFGVSWAFVTGDEFPPDSVLSFQEACNLAQSPRIVNGQLIS